MTCPDPTVRMVFVHWMFNIVQAIVIVVVWKVIEILWRMARMARARRKRK
jgi:MFS superfamily sulfate permease-like transporter